MNREEARALVYFYLGTSSRNPAFPSTAVNLLLQQALDALHADYPEGVFVTKATLQPDVPTTGRLYTLASQTPPVLNLQKIDEIRLKDGNGIALRELPAGQHDAWGANVYALTGFDEQATIELSPMTTAGQPLYVKYAWWPERWASDAAPMPGVPTQFTDVPCLLAAELAFASGDEQRFPESYARQLFDRKAQLLQYLGNRSRDVTIRRHTTAEGYQ